MPTTKAPSIFADGWTQEKQRILDSTVLPEKIRCKQCNKLKAVPGFSQRQLGIAKQSFARNPRLTAQGLAIVVCRQCTEGQVMELECSQCGLVKSLEGFTKAQRRDPDLARCIECVNQHLDEVTAADDTAEIREHGTNSDESEEEDSDTDTNPYASEGDLDESVGGLESHTQRLTVDEAEAAHGNMSSVGNKQGGHSWRQYAQQHGRDFPGSLHKGNSPVLYTGYDASGKGHARIRSPSTIGSNALQVAPRSNFPKIKAHKPDKSEKSSNADARVHRSDGLIQVSEKVRAARGRQRDDQNSDSDSDFGCL